jgi:hypothetical protein
MPGLIYGAGKRKLGMPGVNIRLTATLPAGDESRIDSEDFFQTGERSI